MDLDALTERAFVAAWYAGLVADLVIAQSEAQREALWVLCEGVAEAQASDTHVLKSDTSVPVGATADFVVRATNAVQIILPGAIIIPFGHIGDGNIHFNVRAPEGMEERDFLRLRGDLAGTINAVTLKLGGSISAEHGIGTSKREQLAKAKLSVEIRLMHRIKDALDPNERLKPGKVLPDSQ